ncbi:orotidine-5'-phosphate decarboxylase [Anaerohalosphaera lusitana]|uniref:orotidine-5'-phosphate decarboxylase n=1 Tax=Anaerohalosphaera lusitana TaxID=1936003 RepID=UPI001472EE70|nr:orotidine-5'-phosphate decarboxylase [Anaerohalosphaera lusitana]
MASHFGDRLCVAVEKKRTPLVVGLDPVYDRLPAEIREHPEMNDSEDAGAAIDAVATFCNRVLHLVAGKVPAVKINSAYFEKYLWEGVEAYYALVSEAESLGVEVIGDVKRGDIGHTAGLYSQAHLQNPIMTGLEDIITPDAITVNGFAGADGIVPFADTANAEGKGVFVWVRASNPSAGVIQDFADADGVKMYEKLAEVVGEIAKQSERTGERGYSNVGMVVGGTSPEATTALREKYPEMWILVPGYGSQGATAADCVRFCNKDKMGALVNSSRSIIYAYDKPEYQEKFGGDWEKCIVQAVDDANAELREAIGL